ncbi:MAG: hypothetical protein ACTHJM_10230 [Marmoricola sp.]
MTSSAASHLPYDDADSCQEMAADASVCRRESHLSRAEAALAAARRTVEVTPTALLQARRTVRRSALNVSDAAAKFASKVLD